MIKVTKLSLRKIINKILDAKRGKITGVKYEFPEYKLIQISSNGETLEKAETETKLIITFKTAPFRKNNYGNSTERDRINEIKTTRILS